MTDKQHRVTPEQMSMCVYAGDIAADPRKVADAVNALSDRIAALEASAGIGQPATPANTSAPADSLVERVASICASGSDDEPESWRPEARAAIREVAAWPKEQQRRGLVDLPEALDQEAER